MQRIITMATDMVKSVLGLDKSAAFWMSAGAVSVVGSAIASYFGGWSVGLEVLLWLMGLDFASGLILGAFGKSKKSESGGLNSTSAWLGLMKKFVTLGIILGAAQIDRLMGTGIIRDAIIISYIVGEAISLSENALLLGIPIPDAWKKAIDVLSKKADGGDGK